MTSSPLDDIGEDAASAGTGPAWRAALRLPARRPVAFVALLFLLVVVLVALLGSTIAPYDPLSGDVSASLQGPSAAHWLGTDQAGRDTLSRLLVGTRPTLLYTLEAVSVALVLGLALGTVSGFVGGKVDQTLITLSDILMSIPGMVMLLVALTIFQGRMQYAMFAIGVLLSGPLMRVIRATTLSYRREVFVEAARVSGLSTPSILVRHILPRVMGTVLIQASMLTGMALLMVTGVAYLGFGTQPPKPSWGSMIGDGAQIFGTQPTLMIVAGLAITLTVVATGLLGDGLRDLTVERWSGERTPGTTTATAGRRRGRLSPAAADNRAGDEPAGALLEVRGLEVAYRRDGAGVRVVHGVDLTVPHGSTVALVGESGSGKSAIARAVLGILRGGEVTAGTVVFDGEDITAIDSYSPRERTELRIGYISQEPHLSLDPTWRVGAQLTQALRHHSPHLSRTAAKDRALELLDRVRMRDPAAVFARYPHELSGGMAQRVAIARALCCSPKLLIADEPTTALDVTVQAEVLDLLREIQAGTGMAILLITHDWGVVADLAEHAVVLRDGQVVEAATTSTLFARPTHPYTSTLLMSNPAVMIETARRQRQDQLLRQGGAE